MLHATRRQTNETQIISVTEMINKRTSNMYPPIPKQFSFTLKLSMYKLKSIGKIIPPCLTPFVTQKLVEHVLPQRIDIF